VDSGNKIVRIGVIGAGRVSEIYHLPVLAVMPDVKLTWICDLDKPRALKLARFYRIREVQQAIVNCSDVDIVLVAMPVGLRDGVLE
jgi:predicted dehydrogenase